MPLPAQTRALLFDVFGTCVDWRSSVTSGLHQAAETALNAATSSIPSAVRLRASSMNVKDWGEFAQQWRNGYGEYTKSRAADPSLPVHTIDEHHLESLKELLVVWGLEGLWDAEQVHKISLVWHKLNPWADSAAGIRSLSSHYWTCTLSNGNMSLLKDLQAYGSLDFRHIFSAEQFGTFKPNKRIYLGAAELLGIPPSQCTMVAAHLADLQAAKGCGYSTIYVQRPLEEAWNEEKIEQAKEDGFVDVWVTSDENGFVAVDEKLKAHRAESM